MVLAKPHANEKTKKNAVQANMTFLNPQISLNFAKIIINAKDCQITEFMWDAQVKYRYMSKDS